MLRKLLLLTDQLKLENPTSNQELLNNQLMSATFKQATESQLLLDKNHKSLDKSHKSLDPKPQLKLEEKLLKLQLKLLHQQPQLKLEENQLSHHTQPKLKLDQAELLHKLHKSSDKPPQQLSVNNQLLESPRDKNQSLPELKLHKLLEPIKLLPELKAQSEFPTEPAEDLGEKDKPL